MLREAITEPSFADEVAEATGLAPMFAKGVLDRCCKRAGIVREAMQRADIGKILPHLESALLVYKKGPEVLATLDRLKRLATNGATRKRAFVRRRGNAPARPAVFSRHRRPGSVT